MRGMIIRNTPLSVFRELEEAIFSPNKYGRAFDAGSKDDPTIIERHELITRKYRAWVEEDGSYHEEVITDEDELIENPGGTD